jgi:hypothetical protein
MDFLGRIHFVQTKLVDDFIFQKQQSANEKKTANGKSAKKASANSNQQSANFLTFIFQNQIF